MALCAVGSLAEGAHGGSHSGPYPAQQQHARQTAAPTPAAGASTLQLQGQGGGAARVPCAPPNIFEIPIERQ